MFRKWGTFLCLTKCSADVPSEVVTALQDNLPVIHLIAKKPVGILHLLDDESNFPKATDLSFLEKCHYNHALDELYSRPRMSSMEFAVRHYAGQVWYSVDGFLDKNRDTLRQDVVDLLISSKIQVGNNLHVFLYIPFIFNCGSQTVQPEL
jgi:myosin heavy subunit